MHTVIIVDDEPGALSVLRTMVSKFSDFDIVGEFSNADYLVEIVSTLKPDILFLDIHLGDKSGMQIAKDLYNARSETKIVIVSAHEKYAINAFEYNIIDYILKPVSRERLNRCIQKIEKASLENIDPEPKTSHGVLSENTVRFKTKSGFLLVNPIEIVCLEADQMYTKMVLAKQTDHFLAQNMGRILSHIDHSHFIRISRSSVINVKYLREVNRRQKKCLMFDGINEYELPISRNGMKVLDDYFDQKAPLD